MNAHCATGRLAELTAKVIGHRTAAAAPPVGRPCMRQPARRPQQSRDLVCQAAVAVEADTQLNIASDVTKLIGALAPGPWRFRDAARAGDTSDVTHGGAPSCTS